MIQFFKLGIKSGLCIALVLPPLVETMADIPPLDALLSHRPLGRILQPEDVAREFALIREAWRAGGKALPTAEDFGAVGRGSGTHLLKLVTPRASSSQAVLRFSRTSSNAISGLIPSLDAKKAKVAKIVFRPLEVAGHPARHVVDHVVQPDDLSPFVLGAFVAAFGDEALAALRAGLEAPLAVTRLPAAEFPIIFLPRPGGGDLQATPVSPAEAYVRMREVTDPFFMKRVVGGPEPRRGRWSRQNLTAQPQNISGAVGPRRTRFLATMPPVLDRKRADLFRALLGGRYPSWLDASVAEAVVAYANLLERKDEHSNADIRAGLNRRADALIAGARAFVDDVCAAAAETLEEVRLRHPEAKIPEPPPLPDIILGRRWPEGRFDRARWALTSDHFRSRLPSGGR
jgi:hypothetical protein